MQEVFQEVSFNMVSLQHFPNLLEVWIMDQPNVEIRGLNASPALEVLGIMGCGVAKISGLEKNVNLRKLYLCNNNSDKKISNIENIAHLENLEVLHLHNNNIEDTAGLEGLFNLKDLNLAVNKIRTISRGLKHLTQLKSLNLSGNNISDLNEIAHLSSLTQLRDVAFGDPHFRSCPLCLLNNYRVFAVHFLPQLEVLDTFKLSHDDKKEARLAYFLRKMRHGMHVKKLHRESVRTISISCTQK